MHRFVPHNGHTGLSRNWVCMYLQNDHKPSKIGASYLQTHPEYRQLVLQTAPQCQRERSRKKTFGWLSFNTFKVPPITNPRTSILFAVQNVRISYCYVQPYGTGNYHHLPSLQWETIKFCRGRASRNGGTMWNWTCTFQIFQISEPKSIKIHISVISPQAFPMRLLEL